MKPEGKANWLFRFFMVFKKNLISQWLFLLNYAVMYIIKILINLS
jgi:hypothetical protein